MHVISKKIFPLINTKKHRSFYIRRIQFLISNKQIRRVTRCKNNILIAPISTSIIHQFPPVSFDFLNKSLNKSINDPIIFCDSINNPLT